MILNFTIRDASQYIDSGGGKGAYSYDPATSRIVFKKGLLDGAMPKGFYSIYREPRGKPTVTFLNPKGIEAAFCAK